MSEICYFVTPYGCHAHSHNGNWAETFDKATKYEQHQDALRNYVSKQYHWIPCFGNNEAGNEKFFALVEGELPNFAPGPYTAQPLPAPNYNQQHWAILDAEGDTISEVISLSNAEKIISHLNR